jgi:hypothetical protein
LSNQRQLVLVRASSRLLVLDVLHYASQVRNVASWEVDLPEGAATDSERQLAEQLIALASGPVDWGRYRDTSAKSWRPWLKPCGPGNLRLQRRKSRRSCACSMLSSRAWQPPVKDRSLLKPRRANPAFGG